jgi:hypothetical protein
MDKHAKRVFFERLCQLRDDYRRLGPDDSTSAIDVESMIARATTALEQEASPLIVMLERASGEAN